MFAIVRRVYIYLCDILDYRKSKDQARSRNHGTKNAIKAGYLNRHKDTSHTHGIASISSHTFSSSRLHEKNSTAGVVRRRAKGSEREGGRTDGDIPTRPLLERDTGKLDYGLLSVSIPSGPHLRSFSLVRSSTSTVKLISEDERSGAVDLASAGSPFSVLPASFSIFIHLTSFSHSSRDII